LYGKVDRCACSFLLQCFIYALLRS
jgi:hypothetical protein